MRQGTSHLSPIEYSLASSIIMSAATSLMAISQSVATIQPPQPHLMLSFDEHPIGFLQAFLAGHHNSFNVSLTGCFLAIIYNALIKQPTE